MKLLTRQVPTIEFEWDIEIFTSSSNTVAASTLDLTDTEYDRFVDSLIAQFKAAKFDKYEDPEYTHDSNRRSLSQYYTFTKFYNGVRIIVVVNLRVSDHKDSAKYNLSPEEKRRKYVSRIAIEIADKYSASPIPHVVDIIFNDEHFNSYMSAQLYVNHELHVVESEVNEYLRKYHSN